MTVSVDQNGTMTSVAQVPTKRAGRYAKQLASHMGRKVPFTWDEATGTGSVTFSEGRVSAQLTAKDDALVMELESPAEDLDRYEDVLGRHLVRFGARDELVCTWQRSNGEAGTVQVAPDESETPA